MLVKAVRPLLLAGAKVTSQQERAMGFRLARIPYRLTSRTLKASPILVRGGPSQDDLDNHANQCNPNNDAYWDSRGYEDGRPDDCGKTPSMATTKIMCREPSSDLWTIMPTSATQTTTLCMCMCVWTEGE